MSGTAIGPTLHPRLVPVPDLVPQTTVRAAPSLASSSFRSGSRPRSSSSATRPTRLSTFPDAVLRDGLFAGLVDRLRSAGLRDDQVRDLACPALTLRVTGYRYVHVLLVLGGHRRCHRADRGAHPNTITSYLLDLLVDLEPTIDELGDRGLLPVDPTNVYGVPRPLQDLGLMTLASTHLYDRHIVLSGTERDLDLTRTDNRAAAVEREPRPSATPSALNGRITSRPGGVVAKPEICR
jgi:hypothetical protein